MGWTWNTQPAPKPEVRSLSPLCTWKIVCAEESIPLNFFKYVVPCPYVRENKFWEKKPQKNKKNQQTLSTHYGMFGGLWWYVAPVGARDILLEWSLRK